MRQMVGVDAGASVGHGEDSIAPYGNDGPLAVGIMFIEVHIAGLDCAFSTLRHGIARVGRKVHENLLDLYRIQSNSAHPLSGNKDEFDIFPDKAGKSLDDCTDHWVDFSDAQGLRLLAAESEQLAGQVGGAVGRGKNLVHPRLGGTSRDDRIECEFGVARDDG